MIRKIRLWPDPVLTRRCAEIGEVDDVSMTLAQDMLETMYFAEGRGLAAPQVGEAVRLFVMDATWKVGQRSPRVFIDPIIEAQSDDTSDTIEACLSIPGISASVTRPAKVRVASIDETGRARTDTFSGIEAVIVQHEIDHLDGFVTFDRVSPEERYQLERMYAQ